MREWLEQPQWVVKYARQTPGHRRTSRFHRKYKWIIIYLCQVHMQFSLRHTPQHTVSVRYQMFLWTPPGSIQAFANQLCSYWRFSVTASFASIRGMLLSWTVEHFISSNAARKFPPGRINCGESCLSRFAFRLSRQISNYPPYSGIDTRRLNFVNPVPQVWLSVCTSTFAFSNNVWLMLKHWAPRSSGGHIFLHSLRRYILCILFSWYDVL